MNIAASNLKMVLEKLSRPAAALFVGLVLVCAAHAQQYDPSAEQWLLQAVNGERAKLGLGRLELDPGLMEIARMHSVRMAQEGELSHQFNHEPIVSARVASTGMRFNFSGENVAFDSSVESAHHGLMLSPPHHANIVKPEYNAIGIGIVRKGNRLYVTQDFARRLPDVSLDGAEQTIAESFAQARRSAGTPPLKRVARPELRNTACEMARTDSLSPRLVPRYKGMQEIVVWTATELEELPANVRRLKNAQASGYSLGACLAKSASYPNPVYWVALITYY